jgi:hypothetical protein
MASAVYLEAACHNKVSMNKSNLKSRQNRYISTKYLSYLNPNTAALPPLPPCCGHCHHHAAAATTATAATLLPPPPPPPPPPLPPPLHFCHHRCRYRAFAAALPMISLLLTHWWHHCAATIAEASTSKPFSRFQPPPSPLLLLQAPPSPLPS